MDYLNIKELYHHGILGMKWGIRRYQNEDGTLKPEGKKRYGGDLSEQNIDRIDSKEASNEAEIYNKTSKALNDTANLLPTNNGKTVKKDYSNLPDAELKARISRLELEKKYGDLSGDTRYVKSGSEVAREVLQTVGSVVGIVGTSVLIAQGVQDLKRGNVGGGGKK